MPEMLSDEPGLSAPGGDLEAVLAGYLRAAEAGRAPDRMELLAGHPDLAPELAAFFAGQDRFGRLAAPLRDAVSAVQESTIEEKLAEGGRLGDFRIIRQIGRGGMGVVYEAVQISLGRRVALKVLPFAAALDSKQLQRFKNEAHAAAGLQHTNIVPVYFVGCERGVHFYAMQFVEGQTLAALIRELRQLEGREGEARREGEAPSEPRPLGSGSAEPLGKEARQGPRPPEDLASELISGRWAPAKPSVGDSPPTGLYVPSAPDQAPDTATVTPRQPGPTKGRSTNKLTFFRTAANLGIQAAQALEHAHQMGVTHRDIKPGNLMVDARGNLWISDFGLAYRQGGCDLTMSGDLLGTLRYMSPEQAMAKRVLVDHRTDIYSLGASLYELLTLEPIFSGQDRQELLQQIAFEEPKPPRRLNTRIPRELETIVLKALEKSPADRYATAQDLADDLGRYLRDEPIKAKRPTALQRLRKWTRRHQAVVVTGTVLTFVFLALAVLGLAISNWLITREQGEAMRQRDDAYAQRRLARRAVDKMFTQVAEKWLAQQPHLEPLQRQFLQEALEFYQEFAREPGTDPAVQHEAARAYRRAGDIQQRLEQMAGAEEAYGQAIALLEQPVADPAGEGARLRELAASYNNLALVLRGTGRTREAEQAFRRAIAVNEQLAAVPAATIRDRRQLAEAYYQLCLLLQDTGRSQEAEQPFSRVVELYVRLAADPPPDPDARQDLAAGSLQLGTLLRAAGRLAEAERAFRQARDLFARLADDFRAAPDYRRKLARAQHYLGLLLQDIDRLPEAEEAYGQALALYERLADDFPGVAEYRRDLASTAFHLSSLLENTGRLPEAERAYRRALALREKLATEFRDEPDYRLDLAITHLNLAGVLQGTGRPREAEAAYLQARDLLDQLDKDFPARADYRRHLASCHLHLGTLLRTTGRMREAEEAYRQALALYEQRPGDLPEAPDHRRDRSGVANCHLHLGVLLQATGRTGEAEPQYRRAVDLYDRLPDEFRDVPAFRWGLALGHWNLAALLRDSSRLPEAERSCRQAGDLLARLAADSPSRPDYRAEWARSLHTLAGLLVTDGRPREAERAYSRAVTLREKLAADFPGAAEYGRDLAAGRAALAWLLAASPDPHVRDATRAVEVARKAVAQAPQDPEYRGTLGVAQYRAGNWKAAVEELDRALHLAGGGSAASYAGFFLAMAHWQLGEREQARKFYDRAAEWMAKNPSNDEELRRFRAEAAELLGIKYQPTAKEKETPHAKAPSH